MKGMGDGGSNSGKGMPARRDPDRRHDNNTGSGDGGDGRDPSWATALGTEVRATDDIDAVDEWTLTVMGKVSCYGDYGRTKIVTCFISVCESDTLQFQCYAGKISIPLIGLGLWVGARHFRQLVGSIDEILCHLFLFLYTPPPTPSAAIMRKLEEPRRAALPRTGDTLCSIKYRSLPNRTHAIPGK